ncbi:MAG: 5-oxoprolinase [Acidobacteria bacterium RIFCSPLOWO2_02_FULL_59_13]|nr:MAG: 5-oxoprolinase [Acidobacteria bacterium RIFCSPLOWO2_02_FULL_59_13]
MLTEQARETRTVESHPADPVVTEIIRNGLVAITEQMKSNLMRTACNMIIYEAQDFTVGLFDTRGQIVSIGIGLPMFVRGMSDTVKAMMAHFGADGIDPGDVLLTNDAYVTGSHLNHMTFAVPIFHEQELVGFSACMAHWQDIGGSLDGMTKDIYSEGLQMPIVKVYRRGEPNEDILAVIRMNVRLPERAMGDLNAQVAATRMGARCFLDLIQRYGREAVLGGIAAIMDHAEALAREQVLSIPDGVYEAESFMDDDGIDKGQRIPIKVKVIVAGDEMTVDLTDVSEQVKGFYNSGEATGRACCQVAFKCLTSALEKPINEGSFRPLKIILPPGRVVSAVRPSPMRWWMTFPMTIVDTIFKALAPAIPERVIAAHHADLMSCMINGRMPGDGKIYLVSGGLIGGGWGAKQGQDGASATICINDGDTHNSPVEQIEAKYPMIVERYALREDSGGAGTWQGGLGVEKVVRAVSEFMFNVQIERVHCRPWGLFGGHPGAGNQIAVRSGGEELLFPSGKVLARLLKPEEAYILRSGGGGGYGSPLDRPIEQVESDLREGYISKQRAERCYGIVFKPSGITVDLAATAAKRAELRPSFAHLDWSDTVEPQPGENAMEGSFTTGNPAIFNRCC